MAEMYDKLMNLSLFKGINKETMSSFLEKTHLDFRNFSREDIIITPEEECDYVRCILNGKARIIYKTADSSISMTVVIGEDSFIGLEHLFGLVKTYGITVIAQSDLSLIEFSKRQYVNFIRKHEILLFNYLNYLSLRCQKLQRIIYDTAHISLLNIILRMIEGTAHRDCTNIRLELDDATIQNLRKCENRTDTEKVDKLIDKGVMRIEGNTIVIPSRHEFLSALESLGLKP